MHRKSAFLFVGVVLFFCACLLSTQEGAEKTALQQTPTALLHTLATAKRATPSTPAVAPHPAAAPQAAPSKPQQRKMHETLAQAIAAHVQKRSTPLYLKKQLKSLLRRQREEENQALGVRSAALRHWAEYKLDLDAAEEISRQSARFSHAELKYARKAVRDKRHEQTWARKAYADLKTALKEEAKHPDRFREKPKLTLHQKYVLSADDATDLDMDPFHDRRRRQTPMEKAEEELQNRVFAGDATRSEVKAYDEIEKMKDWGEKKRRNTFMGEVIEKVRKSKYGRRFEQMIRRAEAHAKTAQKYTHVSSGLVHRAKALTKEENRIFKQLQKLKKTPKDVQRVERVVVQLVNPPKKK